MHQSIFKRGTFCYVVPNCRASPPAQSAVGRIVEVVGGPYERLQGISSVVCYDVRYQGMLYYCSAEKLRAINDPDADADVGQAQDGRLAM